MATAVLTTTQTVSAAAAAPSPAAPAAPSKQKLRIRIDNKWYDLTAWQQQHPGGADILHYLNNQDATDAFYSLHSDDAINRLNRMYSTPISKEDVTPLAEVQSFRTLREKLREEGWFQRNAFWESFYILSVYIMCSVGSYLAMHGHPIMAIGLIGLAMQQAGWIGHDYVHGRGDWSYYQGRWMGGLVNGFSSKWWSNKHNTHHCYTNHVGIDEDIANEPIFYLFYPDASNDTPYRQYQHLYMVPVYSFLYVSWRLQSIKYAYAQQNWTELAFIAVNYAWLAWLPWYVSVGSILLGGLLVAVVVTASHQSEDMFDGEAMPNTAYNFIRTQFESTRDAITENFLLEYLWGGMQYQLEHHLFPTMPKYRYASLRPVIKQWAEDNGLPYKAESSKEIMIRNYQTIKAFAKQVSTKDE